MYGFVRTHADGADWENILWSIFGLAGIAFRHPTQDGSHIPFVSKRPCVDDRYIEPHSNFVDIIPNSDQNYRA